jgi:hypothetical protein
MQRMQDRYRAARGIQDCSVRILRRDATQHISWHKAAASGAGYDTCRARLPRSFSTLRALRAQHHRRVYLVLFCHHSDHQPLVTCLLRKACAIRLANRAVQRPACLPGSMLFQAPLQPT